MTHTNPDLDAITAVWLLKKFHPDFANAELRFVPAGKKYEPTEIEKLKTPIIIHVDTGGGEFDHHENNDEKICAASLVLDYLIQHNHVETLHSTSLRRLIAIVCEIDHFREVFWEKADSDRYEFFLEMILDGLKTLRRDQDERLCNFGIDALNGIYQKMQSKIRAEEEIEKGKIINVGVRHGEPLRVIAMETINDEVVKLAQRKGYDLVIRKDPRKGYVRIKAIPNGKIDLTSAYETLKKRDPDATWFLHVSRCMVLNGSTKNPDMKPTRLSLDEVVSIVKQSISQLS